MEPGPLAWATGILRSPFESAPTVSEWPLAGSRGPCRGWELGGLRVCAMRLVPVPVCVLALPQCRGGGQRPCPPSGCPAVPGALWPVPPPARRRGWAGVRTGPDCAAGLGCGPRSGDTSLSLALSLGAPTCWLALPETQQVPHPGTADTGPRRLWGRPVRCGGQAAPRPHPLDGRGPPV